MELPITTTMLAQLLSRPDTPIRGDFSLSELERLAALCEERRVFSLSVDPEALEAAVSALRPDDGPIVNTPSKRTAAMTFLLMHRAPMPMLRALFGVNERRVRDLRVEYGVAPMPGRPKLLDHDLGADVEMAWDDLLDQPALEPWERWIALCQQFPLIDPGALWSHVNAYELGHAEAPGEAPRSLGR